MSGSIEQELRRRKGLWDEVRALGGPDGLEPSQVNEHGLRLVAGQRGIYRDAGLTGPLTPSGDGLTVGLRITGRVYPDDVDDEGVLYHYPRTGHRTTDEREISATKAARENGLPVFAVISEGKRRNVRLGWVLDWDDRAELFLVEFSEISPPKYEPVSDKEPFEPFGSGAVVKDGKQSTRPNQRRFKYQVLQRYGAECAFCPIDKKELLDAAHLIAKEHKGSDHSGNGLPICPTHHRAMDEKTAMLRIDPETLEVVADNGATIDGLRITKTSLNHLLNPPHQDALQYLWDKQEVNTRAKSSG